MAVLLTGDSVMTGCCHCKKIFAHLSLQIAASESMGDSSLYTNKDHLGLCCSAEQQPVVPCEISAPSKTLQPVAL